MVLKFVVLAMQIVSMWIPLDTLASDIWLVYRSMSSIVVEIVIVDRRMVKSIYFCCVAVYWVSNRCWHRPGNNSNGIITLTYTFLSTLYLRNHFPKLLRSIHSPIVAFHFLDLSPFWKNQIYFLELISIVDVSQHSEMFRTSPPKRLPCPPIYLNSMFWKCHVCA